jgi:hypothetical protein
MRLESCLASRLRVILNSLMGVWRSFKYGSLTVWYLSAVSR